MRSSAQLTRTPSQYAEHQARERQRTLLELLTMLKQARERGDHWYTWVADGRPPISREHYALLRRPKGRS